MADLEVWPGRAYPLGASFDGTGTNFALFTEVAEAVELCLFDNEGQERRVPLDEVDAFSWHAYLPNVGRGSATDIESTDRIRLKTACGATPASSCWTRTPALSRDRSRGIPRATRMS